MSKEIELAIVIEFIDMEKLLVSETWTDLMRFELIKIITSNC